jgi:hypothetical protein
MGSLLGLIAAIVIIYFAYVHYVKVDRSGPSDVEQAMQTIDQAQPTPVHSPAPNTLPTPTPSSGLRAPIDRTRQVLQQVERRARETDQP